jgi:hypothetical protein
VRWFTLCLTALGCALLAQPRASAADPAPRPKGWSASTRSPWPECRCDCPLGRNGTDCSIQLTGAALTALCTHFGHTLASAARNDPAAVCVNACNFRGTCAGGFCHCQPGFFGADCSLSLAAGAPEPSGDRPAVEILAGQNYTARRSGPRIYVYELPPELTVYQNLDRLDRPLMYLLWQRVLSAGLRVADPAQVGCWCDGPKLVECFVDDVFEGHFSSRASQ